MSTAPDFETRSIDAGLARALTRRQFFSSSGLGLGAAALASLADPVQAASPTRDAIGGLEGLRRIAPRAKRVIYLFQSGGPSQLDLFDHKPRLKDLAGQDLPASVRGNQRLTGFTNRQKSLPVTPSKFEFSPHGKGDVWLSETLPHTARVADELCVIRSLHTEAINHDPARTLIQTGAQLAGRPSFGSWVWYGLGSECSDLPAFLVLTSHGSCKRTPQPVFGRLWGSGFLPSQYQGVKLQSSGDPILFVSRPAGVDPSVDARTLSRLSRLNRLQLDRIGDPEIEARVQQYEMAGRMQVSVPDLVDLSGESDSIFDLYGEDARVRGSYASNCLLARRLVERGVRFVQLYHVGWDHHESVPRDLPLLCRDTDQATAALITDLKQRGLLDDTLVIWGGEFGRTVFSEARSNAVGYGRDHHGRCFSMWLAGGGIRGGMTWGATDDFSYNVAENPVHVHDLQATILHLLGIDHRQLTFRFQGRDFRLTDVHGEVVREILA